MEFKANIIPKPDIPNRNGVLTTHRAFTQALDDYWKRIETGRALVMVGYPSDKNTGETELTRVSGQIVDIEYDESVHGYVAKVKTFTTPSGKIIEDVLKRDHRLSVAFNRAGKTEPLASESPSPMMLCDDPNLKFLSASFDVEFDKT